MRKAKPSTDITCLTCERTFRACICLNQALGRIDDSIRRLRAVAMAAEAYDRSPCTETSRALRAALAALTDGDWGR